MAEHRILLAQQPAAPAPPVVTLDATPGQIIDLSGPAARDATLSIDAQDLVITHPGSAPVVVRDLVDAAAAVPPPIVQLADAAIPASELVARIAPFDSVPVASLLQSYAPRLGLTTDDLAFASSLRPAPDLIAPSLTVATADDDPLGVRSDYRSDLRGGLPPAPPVEDAASPAALAPEAPGALAAPPDTMLALLIADDTPPVPAVETAPGTPDDDVVILSEPLSGGVVDLGAGTDSLTLAPGENTLTVRGVETLSAGNGDDRLAVDGAARVVDLGVGTDTLDLSAIASSAPGAPGADYQGIEKIDLRGGGANLMTLSAADVLELSPTTDTLLVRGDAGDRVVIGGGWMPAGTQTNPQGEAGSFSVYTQTLAGATATLVVESAISVE